MPALLTGRASHPQPAAVLIGGRPGACRSMVQRRVLRQLGREHAVGLDVDDLRAFHPDYARMVAAMTASSVGDDPGRPVARAAAEPAGSSRPATRNGRPGRGPLPGHRR
ncbi:zeta toxin family protein [Actinoplanes sp. URMC 104]|uniref:zeta toxin family protein n=1 Tax=Actinoplanes sp. URMC 104 TaxID=3423409 RepID=UPI003F1AE62A